MTTCEVQYSIRSGIDNYRQILKIGETTVEVDDIDEAGAAAVAWAHENDTFADPRVSPMIEVLAVFPLDDEEDDE